MNRPPTISSTPRFIRGELHDALDRFRAGTETPADLALLRANGICAVTHGGTTRELDHHRVLPEGEGR